MLNDSEKIKLNECSQGLKAYKEKMDLIRRSL